MTITGGKRLTGRIPGVQNGFSIMLIRCWFPKWLQIRHRTLVTAFLQHIETCTQCTCTNLSTSLDGKMESRWRLKERLCSSRALPEQLSECKTSKDFTFSFSLRKVKSVAA